MIYRIIIVKILGYRKIGILVLGLDCKADFITHREGKINFLFHGIFRTFVVEGSGEGNKTGALVIDSAEIGVGILDRDHIIVDRVSTLLAAFVLEITGIVVEGQALISAGELIGELITGCPNLVIRDRPLDGREDSTVVHDLIIRSAKQIGRSVLH